MTHFGRTEEEWQRLADAGHALLADYARRARLSSYTELNAAVANRTGLEPFDFEKASERAAMGHLLWLIVQRDFDRTGLMLSALVTYLDANDPGSGFYRLAAELTLLPPKSSADDKLIFWSGHVKALYALYAPGHR